VDRTYRAGIEARLRADLSPEHWRLVKTLLRLQDEEADSQHLREIESLLGGLQGRFRAIPIIDTADEIIAAFSN